MIQYLDIFYIRKMKKSVLFFLLLMASFSCIMAAENPDNLIKKVSFSYVTKRSEAEQTYINIKFTDTYESDDDISSISFNGENEKPLPENGFDFYLKVKTNAEAATMDISIESPDVSIPAEVSVKGYGNTQLDTEIGFTLSQEESNSINLKNSDSSDDYVYQFHWLFDEDGVNNAAEGTYEYSVLVTVSEGKS